MPGTGFASEDEDLVDLLLYHFDSYPDMQPDDVYKMLYQGAMGVVHFIADPESAAAHLQREYAAVEADDTIPLIENVSPDGEMVRVNLARVKAENGDPAVLFVMMMKTAREFQPSGAKLAALLDKTRIASEEGKIPLESGRFRGMLETLEGYDFPALHHSDIYREAYDPAYRVILRKYAAELED